MFKGISLSDAIGLAALGISLYNTYGHGRNGGAIGAIKTVLDIVTARQQQQEATIAQVALQTPPPTNPPQNK